MSVNFGKIGGGLLTYITIQTAISIIFSGLIYFKKIQKYENYFMSINIGSKEYLKIVLLENLLFFLESNIKELEFFSLSSIISGFLLIWNAIIFILDIFILIIIPIFYFNLF